MVDYLENEDDHGHDQEDPGQIHAAQALPDALFESVISTRERNEMSERGSFCLVVQAPTADWVNPICKTLKRLGDWSYSISKTSIKKYPTEDDTTERIVTALAGGGRVFGVSHQPSQFLPAAMLSAADKLVVLPPPSPEVISQVVRAVTGSLPVEVPDDLGRGLSFDEIVSCIRHGSTAAECIDRLRNAAKNKQTVIAHGEDIPHVRDLHGMGAVKDWSLALLDDLEAWRRGEIEFSQIASSACIIAGPPGVGKTAMIRSLAKSAGLPLIATSVGEWFATSPGYLDSIIKKIDATFSSARAASPAIIFLDELDAVPSRATISPRGADWWLPVITHLLTTLDGAVSGKTEKLVVVGATNYPEKLDSALTRAGRFDQVIQVGPPDEQALAGILRQHLGEDLASADLTQAAQLAIGNTGATVVQWVRAARRRARLAKRPMEINDLLEAIAPPEKREPGLVRRIAVHEAGHAVAAHALGLSVDAVSIVQSGTTGGFTKLAHDGRVSTRAEVESLVIQILSGRASEQAILKSIGTGSGGGPTSDLSVATRYVGFLHLGSGLGSTLLYRGSADEVPKVLATDPAIAAEVEKELQELYSKALALMQDNKAKVEALAQELVERRYIGADVFLSIMQRSLSRMRGAAHG